MRWCVALAALAACGDHGQPQTPRDAKVDATPDAIVDAFVPPPPPFDAPPPPVVSCEADAGTCQLPPSVCLDTQYLIYYTGGDCAAGTCSFVTNLLYCYGLCENGGCLGGFT